MVAKQCLHSLRASRLMCKTLKGSSIMTNLPQGNLEALKDNPFRDKLWLQVVHLLLIFLILLGNQDNLTSNKFNLVSSKGILLGRVASLTCSKAVPLPSLSNHLDKLVDLKVNQPSNLPSHLFDKDNPRLYKGNLMPSKLVLLGKQVCPKLNQGNLPARWPKLHLFKDILLGLLKWALK